jgi:hypothetical protein
MADDSEDARGTSTKFVILYGVRDSEQEDRAAITRDVSVSRLGGKKARKMMTKFDMDETCEGSCTEEIRLT